MVSFGEIAIVDVNFPRLLLDIVISIAKRCNGRTRNGRRCNNLRRPHDNEEFVFCQNNQDQRSLDQRVVENLN